MTRGNQREIDRARAAARHAGKGQKLEGNPDSRKAADGNALQAKIEAKRKAEAEEAERKAAEEAYRKAAEANGTAKAAAAPTPPAPNPSKGGKKKGKEDLSFLFEDAAIAPKKKGK